MDTVLEKQWEVYALKYAERTDRTRKESFIFDDHSHEAHTIDYFIWVLKSGKDIIIVDTGYDYEEAKRRKIAVLDLVLNNQDIRELYGAGMVLVRPDQIIGWRGSDCANPVELWQLLMGQHASC